MKHLFLAVAATCAALPAFPVLAAWPDDKPIEIVVGFAPGGETDIMARGLAPFIAKQLGAKAVTVVTNKPGASGEIGNAYFQRAKADGYTLGVVNLPPLTFVPLTKKAQYEPKQMVMVARAVSDPTFLVTRADSPFTSLRQVVDALKAHPKSLTFGFNGVGTNGHLAMLQLQNAAGVQLNDIPYPGSGPSKIALLGGQIQFMFTSLTAVPHPEQDSPPLRILAQFMETRAPALQSVPTAREQGIDDVMPSDRGFAYQKDVPAEIRARMEKAIEAALKDPEFLTAAAAYASVISFLPGARWQQTIDANQPALEALARKMGPLN